MRRKGQLQAWEFVSKIKRGGHQEGVVEKLKRDG